MKVGEDERALWSSDAGRWHMGHVGAGRKNVGGTVSDMAARVTGNEVSPELVTGGWNVYLVASKDWVA